MSEMFSGIFQSKFAVPAIPPTFIARSELSLRLQEGMNRKLTLISAPAGFGKSLVVAHWLKNINVDKIWINISREDNDFNNFSKSVIQSASTIVKDFGENILENLNLFNSFQDSKLLDLMIIALEKLPNDLVIVADDSHCLHSNATYQKEFLYFLNHIPDNIHLYLICRLDPPIPLTRLKIREELLEIREKDLRFSPEETGEFFTKVANIQLAQEEIKYFHKITEGWIAGLRMIGFAIEAREKTGDIYKIAMETGREVSYYLEEEVFSLQSEDIQSFLLTTSILSTLNPSLCDAVTGKTDSLTMLETLEKLNLFIILINHKLSLYRYHHFFSEMLQDRLRKKFPDQITELHLKASKWSLDNHLIDDAVFHAHASKNNEFLSDIIETYAEEAFFNGELSKIKNWINMIPEHIIEKRLKLMIVKMWYLIVYNKIDEIEKYIYRTEKTLFKMLDSNGQTVETRTKEELHSMIWFVISIKAYVFGMSNNWDLAKKTFQKSMKFVPKDGIKDVLSIVLYGYCNLSEGKIDDVEVKSWEAMSLSSRQTESNPQINIALIIMKVLIELHRGELSKADKIVSKGIEKYKDKLKAPEIFSEPSAYLLVMKGEILRERGLLEEAEELLLKGLKYSESSFIPAYVSGFGHVCLSRIAFAKGNLEDAVAIVNDTEKRYHPVNMFLFDYIPAFEAMLNIRGGNIEKAGQFIKKTRFHKSGKVVIKNDIHYLEFLTIARYYISKGECNTAIGILDKILDKSKTESRNKRYMEALILSSLALKMSGSTEEGLSMLGQAVNLCAPEGYCRIFLDEGDELTEMLNALLQNSDLYGLENNIKYLNSLLKKDKPIRNNIDSLTKRELEILSQVSNGLSNKEIDFLYLEFLTLARGYISKGDCNKALGILDKILDKFKTESRNKRYEEALILSSLALKKSGRTEDAFLILSQAVNYCAPQGSRRIFLDEGDEIVEMLYELLHNSNMYGVENNVKYLKQLLKKDKPAKNNIDSLTKRELDVLFQVSKGFSNNEISEKLNISPATVKSHIHKVISKLNVDNRNKAVLEAKNMGLL